MPYRDLREFLDFLDKKGELKTSRKDVDTYIEIAKVTDKSSKVEGPAILFNNVKGFDTRVVTGLFGTLDRSFFMIDSNKYDGFRKVAEGITNPIPLNVLKDGPCQEVVKTHKNIDLWEIPVLWHHEKDSHRFITTANCRVKDPDTGICNSSINRVAVQGKDKLTIQSNPPHQLAIIVSTYLERRMKCPIALAIGTDPAVLVASVCGIPPGMDEFEFAGGIRGAAVDVVKCRTVDIEVPAASELVIEGEILPGDEDGPLGKCEYADEAPFGEIHGYFGKQVRSPIIQVTAITHRKDYIYHGLGTAEPPSEHQIFDAIGMQGEVFIVAKNIISPENIGAINAGSFAAVISIKNKRPGQGRQMIHNLLARAGLKKVVIVDDDIDVFNPVEVEWAVQFRASGYDYILTPELPAINLDPMISTPPNLLRKVGIDATLPVSGDKKGRIEVLRDLGPARYPDLDDVDLKDYIGS
ncbi:MAG: UbiD family decarboxylase [Deltaproteobacteria bacterium]|nr:UbiD family decarboxylase [Deltaproteobacteria bacterium]